MQNLLSVENLCKHFPLPKPFLFSKVRPVLKAVDGVSLTVREGETYGLVGESGCGKSTFGRTLLQLQTPTSGEVRYYGCSVAEFSPKYANAKDGHTEQGQGLELTKLDKTEMRRLRRDLQIVFQDPYSSLNPRMTVGQIVEEGVATHGFYKRGSEEMRKYVLEILQKCGLQGYMAQRYPHQFSGGQRQRVCIARALAVRPKFVVCDECVSALDVSVQAQILNLLQVLKEKEKLTYLFISHDLSVVRHVSDRIGVMYLGKIVEEGSAEQIFGNPRHPYTVALISAAPNAEETNPEKILLNGQMPSPVSPPTGCPFHTRCFMAQERCRQIPAPVERVEDGHVAACHFAEISTEKKRAIALKKEKLP